ncbi:hypothetical protein L6164_002736 [Bauhinia variegata]|uniref:Uncharacterized protein n=1 Tax=Bauhinia variegata TaxID=167791 RepID=A0ACB9Q4M3_BAUVA|nr:hypothetical protein L6164_002736 [Bauhinia variegata]
MPSSVKCLKNLRIALFGDGFSLIGGLKKLRILSLSGSVLRSFPAEFGHNLQLLDISNCFDLGVIPPNVISCLKNLEEFYLRNSFVQWETEGKATASLAELSHLSHLKALDIHIPDLEVFPKNLYFHVLDYYMITVGDFKMRKLSRCLIIFPRHMAGMLKKLESLDIWSSSVEVIFDIGDNPPTDPAKDICLRKLDIWRLANLMHVIPNLQSLLLGNKEVDLLSCCIDIYNLNSLKALDLWALKNPKFLFRLLHRTPKLEKLNLRNCDFKELLRPGMLTATEEIGIVVQLKDFSLQGMYSLHDIGFEQDPSLFQQLQRLTVFLWPFDQFSPWHGLFQSLDIFKAPCLKKLENLQVSSCRSVEKIFDVNDEFITSETKALALPLKYLTLGNLPALKSVWNLVKNPQGIFSIPDLETVRITSCQSLNFLFPASLAEKLLSLKSLYIENCEEMEEVVGKDETDAEVEFPTFKFPCLTKLTLKSLFKLKCFYPGKHNLECLKLESLKVFHCHMLDIFTQELQRMPEDDDGSSTNGCSLYSIHHKVIPKLENLTLNPKDLMMLSCEEFQGSLHNIKRLKLQCFHNVNEGDTLQYGFLNNIPNIEALEVFCSGFNMLFPSQRLEVDDNRIRAQLRELCLDMLPGIESIGLEHSWIDPLCSNLQVLEVSLEQYEYLKVLDYTESEKVWQGKVPLPKACFGQLQTLVVENCDFLSNVIPSLLLPYLKNLKKLQVKNCIYAEVIFDLNDMNIATNEEVSFSLEILTLDQLPNLKHVWSKDVEGIISFRNLQKVQVTNCERLKALFTASLPKNLGKLEKLRIES